MIIRMSERPMEGYNAVYKIKEKNYKLLEALRFESNATSIFSKDLFLESLDEVYSSIRKVYDILDPEWEDEFIMAEWTEYVSVDRAFRMYVHSVPINGITNLLTGLHSIVYKIHNYPYNKDINSELKVISNAFSNIIDKITEVIENV